MIRVLLLLTLVGMVGGCKKKPPETTPAPVVLPPIAPPPPPPPPPVVTPAPIVKRLQRVYFDYDQSTLRSDAKAALDSDVALLQEHSDVRLEIQGHCDERGTTEYNIALGQRRAQAVVNYLSSKGIAKNRLKVVSYGEERPLVNGGDESSWSQNRRAELVILSGGDGKIKGSNE